VAVSFVTEEERGQLKAVERLIRKTIPVDRDHPFEAQPDLPPPSWTRPAPANQGQGKKKDRGGRHFGRMSFRGRNQPDFGQKGGRWRDE